MQLHKCPVNNHLNPHMTPNGIEASDFTFDIADTHKKIPFTAKWIWAKGGYQSSDYSFYTTTKTPQKIALFQKTFTLKTLPKKASAYISADVKYRLIINGLPIGCGPSESGGDYGSTAPFDYRFYDNYDILYVLQKGENNISVIVTAQPFVQSDCSSGHPGLIFEAELDDTIVTSDESWKYAYENAYMGPSEYNAVLEQPKLETKFDDTNWDNALVFAGSDSYVRLLPRELPEMMYYALTAKEFISPFKRFKNRIKNSKNLLTPNGKPTIIKKGEPVTFFLNFEKIIPARLYISAKGSFGTVITLNAGETEGKTDHTEKIILSENILKHETFQLLSLKTLQITISNMSSDLEIFELGANFCSYPLVYRGSFKSSSKKLNKIYKACVYTTQICSQSHRLDSPIHQEPLACTGDYLIAGLISYYAFKDSYLTRMDIIRTAYLLRAKNYKMFHTSYSLLWIQMISDYTLYTGDNSVTELCKDDVFNLLERFIGYLGKNNLPDNAPDYMFIDWVFADGYNLHHPPKTGGLSCLSAFLISALQNGAKIAAKTGDAELEKKYILISEKIKAAFNTLLWDSEKGLYTDGINSNVPTTPGEWLPKDLDGKYYSQHTNSLAVLYGIAPKEKQKEIMEKVINDKSLLQAQPYFMHFVFEALSKAELFGKYGLEQLLRWNELLKENEHTLKEVWSGFDCDYSHAWGGTPAYQIFSKILGVTPPDKENGTIKINPTACGLRFARGVIPTPYGNIEIEIKKGQVKRYKIK